MNDTLVLRAQIILKTVDFHSFASGVDAVFRKIDSRWGVKAYAYKDLRDQTYKLQGKLAAHGVAPQLGPKFTVTRRDFKLYGYITEVAGKVAFDEFDNWKPNNGITHQAYKNYKTFRLKLIRLGFKPNDLHYFNVGKIAGRFVVIDCGHFRDFERNEDWQYDAIDHLEGESDQDLPVYVLSPSV